MKATINALVIEVPDTDPTPRIIFDREKNQAFVLTTDNQFISVAWYDNTSGILVNANGSIVLEGSK